MRATRPWQSHHMRLFKLKILPTFFLTDYRYLLDDYPSLLFGCGNILSGTKVRIFEREDSAALEMQASSLRRCLEWRSRSSTYLRSGYLRSQLCANLQGPYFPHWIDEKLQPTLQKREIRRERLQRVARKRCCS